MNNRRPPKQSTLLVRILNKQNNTWQGTVTWVDNNATQTFRSALELIKIIDSTVDVTDRNKLIAELEKTEKE